MYQIFRVIPFQRFPLKPRYLNNYTLFQLISTEKKNLLTGEMKQWIAHS